jgi:hypothetical protein
MGKMRCAYGELLGKHLLEALSKRWWEVNTKVEYREVGCEADVIG